jgi:hypothetical protein
MGYGIDRLTPEEVAFFKANGYLVKENALDPALVKRARELWWSKCPSPHVRQDDPASWIGGFAEDPKLEALKAAGTQSNHVSGLSWGCRDVGGSEEFLEMLPRAVWGAAEQLCGAGTLVYPAGDTKPGANYAHPGANRTGEGSPGQACRGVYVAEGEYVIKCQSFSVLNVLGNSCNRTMYAVYLRAYSD